MDATGSMMSSLLTHLSRLSDTTSGRLKGEHSMRIRAECIESDVARGEIEDYGRSVVTVRALHH